MSKVDAPGVVSKVDARRGEVAAGPGGVQTLEPLDGRDGLGVLLEALSRHEGALERLCVDESGALFAAAATARLAVGGLARLRTLLVPNAAPGCLSILQAAAKAAPSASRLARLRVSGCPEEVSGTSFHLHGPFGTALFSPSFEDAFQGF